MSIVESQSRIRARNSAFTDGARYPAPRWLIAIIATSLSAGILMAAVVPGWIGVARVQAPASDPVSVRQSADALPLYELPAISVVADRKTELAKIERDEQLAHLKQARSKVAVKPPV
jgi:hypothetical protein